jgi:hypothetical protein
MRATIQAVQPWATPAALILGAAIIGGCLIASRNEARYAISTIPGPEGNLSAWRIDTTTGDVSLCIFEKDDAGPFTELLAKADSLAAVVKCRASIGGPKPPKK